MTTRSRKESGAPIAGHGITPGSTRVRNFFKGVMKIEPNEFTAVLVSFAFVFILMAAYYILRPVRDAMASDWSDAQVSMLWTLNFFISAAAVALYGFAVSRIRFQYLVPAVYAFFALSFIIFFVAIVTVTQRSLIDKSFYVWVSVFSLFHISVFWSYMADTFNTGQARRLFAVIAAGASAGALVGPSLPALFAGKVGTDNLMLIAGLMLIIPVPLILYLGRIKITHLHNEDVHADLSAAKIGGSLFSGFRLFFTSPYLLAIGAFILLYTMIGSFVYFEQKNLLAEYDRATRTQILGTLDWIVNILTFGLAFLATGRLVQKSGMGFTLALIPVVVAAGLLILAFAPLVTVLLALQVARRAGNYAITRPAREMLFTEVDRETRFKAKPVIDIVVYRGGDMVSGWVFTGLTQGLGLGMAPVAMIGAAIAALWTISGVYLGRSYNSASAESSGRSVPVPASASQQTG